MIGNLTMAELAAIRRLSPTDAEAYLHTFAASNDITPDEFELALKLAGRDLVKPQPPTLRRGFSHDASRSKWFITAWLLGASWTDLAYLHGIRRQTVMSAADTLMPSFLRQPARLQSKLAPEKLSMLRRQFLNCPDKHDLAPVELAEFLLSTTEHDDA